MTFACSQKLVYQENHTDRDYLNSQAAQDISIQLKILFANNI